MNNETREIVKKVVDEAADQVAAYLAEHEQQIEKLDTNEVMMVHLTRVSQGLSPHPDIGLAAIKMFGLLELLAHEDGKEIVLSVGTARDMSGGLVVVQFGKAVRQIAMPKAGALELAASLSRKASQLP